MAFIQAVSLLARLFDAAAGDMGMVTYSVCVTGARRGMIHCVPDTTALADIHMRKGLITGVFSKMPLLEHLQRLHPECGWRWWRTGAGGGHARGILFAVEGEAW